MSEPSGLQSSPCSAAPDGAVARATTAPDARSYSTSAPSLPAPAARVPSGATRTFQIQPLRSSLQRGARTVSAGFAWHQLGCASYGIDANAAIVVASNPSTSASQ